MAFDPNDRLLTEAIKESNVKRNQAGIKVPTNTDHENTKAYTFTMKPSNREKLNVIAEKYDYVSASKFLNDLIENLE